MKGWDKRGDDYLKRISSSAERLKELAQSMYDDSEDFPAVNRNAKRVVTSTEMLRIYPETD